jgi:hypothetical protein
MLDLDAIISTNDDNDECMKRSTIVSKVTVVRQIIRPKCDCNEESAKPLSKRMAAGLTAKNHQRHFIRHDYEDHSGEIPSNEEEEMIQRTLHAVNKNDGSYVIKVNSKALNSVKRGLRGGVLVPFPLKLHELLDTIEADGHADVLSWQPHGRSFRVQKAKEFLTTIMPRYFNQTKLTSFQRQLNLYGFTRITQGRDKGGYYHKLFLRGKLFLANRIERHKVKGTKIKASTSPETEPDLYAMPFVDVTYSTLDKGLSLSANEACLDDSMAISTATRPSFSPLPQLSAAIFDSPAQETSNVFRPIMARSNSMRTLDDDDEASFEGMSFHLVTPDQLKFECELEPVISASATSFSSRLLIPRIRQTSFLSDGPSPGGDWRKNDELLDRRFADALTFHVPSVSFDDEESSMPAGSRNSISITKRTSLFDAMAVCSSCACSLDADDEASFEGMTFHLVE